MKPTTHLLVVTVVAGLMSLVYGFLEHGPVASVIGMLWLLVGLVAYIGRHVLGALCPADSRAADRGGADEPSWMKGK